MGWKCDKYLDYQSKGNIQLFDDPMSGDYLYFGYVLVSGDGYSFESDSFYSSDIEEVVSKVYEELLKLIELGIVKNDVVLEPYKVIAFAEYS